MEELQGQVERITYTSERTGYTIARLKVRGRPDLVTVVGGLMAPPPGAVVRLTGQWKNHPKYGEQFEALTCDTLTPATVLGIRKYLGSGLVKGVGPRIAERIVKAFGEHTLDIIETDIERLSRVEGVGRKRIDLIRRAWEEQKEIREVMVFLQGHGVSAAYAARIFKQYGKGSLDVVRKNPYRLATDIYGIGFKTADVIAAKLGFDKNSPVRAEAGILHVLSELADDGHVFYPYEPLLAECVRLLEVERDILTDAFARVDADRRIRVEDMGTDDGLPNQKAVYLTPLHVCETGIARNLNRIRTGPRSLGDLPPDKALAHAQSRLDFPLAERQAEAVRVAASAKIMVITGGPGTGKTTLVRAILEVFQRLSSRILMAAPTGRAAKRLSETTGHEAVTLHRLLQFTPATGAFEKNDEHPLSCDALVLDEVSMIDTVLLHHLLKAVPSAATLILVGDVNQLPSVGPGSVLRDIIASGAVPVVRLDHIFRQARESRIIVNAHRVNQGKFPHLDEGPSSDFYFIEKSDPGGAVDVILRLVRDRIPHRFGLDPLEDVQVLTPMHRGTLGAGNLNRVLQDALNPDGTTLEKGLRSYRAGDKVMQVRNNYDKDVFNGDIGRILHMDNGASEAVIRFDGRDIPYDFSELDETLPAYAISIHKSQGSEYPAVVVPVMMQHYPMLQRNLIYTAITRGRSLVVLVGERRALALAIRNDKTTRRHTRLAERLADAFRPGPSLFG